MSWPIRKPKPPESRFWGRVEYDTNGGCCLWSGGLRDGYAAFNDGTRMRMGHHYRYETDIGPVPEGLQLDHVFSKRCCVNPHHLEPVTCRENLMRGDTLAARNAAKTVCLRGHPFTVENTQITKKGRHCK